MKRRKTDLRSTNTRGLGAGKAGAIAQLQAPDQTTSTVFTAENHP